LEGGGRWRPLRRSIQGGPLRIRCNRGFSAWMVFQAATRRKTGATRFSGLAGGRQRTQIGLARLILPAGTRGDQQLLRGRDGGGYFWSAFSDQTDTGFRASPFLQDFAGDPAHLVGGTFMRRPGRRRGKRGAHKTPDVGGPFGPGTLLTKRSEKTPRGIAPRGFYSGDSKPQPMVQLRLDICRGTGRSHRTPSRQGGGGGSRHRARIRDKGKIGKE